MTRACFHQQGLTSPSFPSELPSLPLSLAGVSAVLMLTPFSECRPFIRYHDSTDMLQTHSLRFRLHSPGTFADIHSDLFLGRAR